MDSELDELDTTNLLSDEIDMFQVRLNHFLVKKIHLCCIITCCIIHKMTTIARFWWQEDNHHSSKQLNHQLEWSEDHHQRSQALYHRLDGHSSKAIS
jgi:hypothetical protein